MIGLAASTGLRISEIIRLDREDVDLKTGVLNVRCSKFNKSRLVPVHKTTLDVIHNYAVARDVAFPNCQTVAFFVNTRQKRCVRNTIQQLFAGIACRTGLRGSKGRGPTFHDLRHRFATERLVLWYEAGIDVYAMLPVLATYMGHVHYTDTAYYITTTAKLMTLASERLRNRMDYGFNVFEQSWQAMFRSLAPSILKSVFCWDTGFTFSLPLANRRAVPLEVFFSKPLTSTTKEIDCFR